MPYTIHFIGLVCFIPRAENEYFVALPNGLNVKSLCNGEYIHKHQPFLIIPGKDIEHSDLTGPIVDSCLVYDLTDFKGMIFEAANASGSVLDVVNHQKIPSWLDLDPGFVIDPFYPKNVIVSTTIRRGVLSLRRIPRADSFMSELLVPTGAGPITVKVDDKVIKLKNNAEVVVANVAPEWIDNHDYPDDDQHFFIYHVLGTVTGPKPKCDQPKPDSSVPESTSQHPFIDPDRGLRVSCANTTT